MLYPSQINKLLDLNKKRQEYERLRALEEEEEARFQESYLIEAQPENALKSNIIDSTMEDSSVLKA